MKERDGLPLCNGCEKVIGIEVNIERRTYWDSRTVYEVVEGVYVSPSGRLKLDFADNHIETTDPTITFQCDYCGQEFEKAEVIQIMLQLQKIDNEIDTAVND